MQTAACSDGVLDGVTRRLILQVANIFQWRASMIVLLFPQSYKPQVSQTVPFEVRQACVDLGVPTLEEAPLLQDRERWSEAFVTSRCNHCTQANSAVACLHACRSMSCAAAWLMCLSCVCVCVLLQHQRPEAGVHTDQRWQNMGQQLGAGSSHARRRPHAAFTAGSARCPGQEQCKAALSALDLPNACTSMAETESDGIHATFPS